MKNMHQFFKSHRQAVAAAIQVLLVSIALGLSQNMVVPVIKPVNNVQLEAMQFIKGGKPTVNVSPIHQKI